MLTNNKWIKKSHFSKDKIKIYAIVSASFQDDVQTLIDYLWEDKAKHFEESVHTDNHMFKVLQRLREAIKK